MVRLPLLFCHSFNNKTCPHFQPEEGFDLLVSQLSPRYLFKRKGSTTLKLQPSNLPKNARCIAATCAPFNSLEQPAEVTRSSDVRYTGCPIMCNIIAPWIPRIFHLHILSEQLIDNVDTPRPGFFRASSRTSSWIILSSFWQVDSFAALCKQPHDKILNSKES